MSRALSALSLLTTLAASAPAPQPDAPSLERLVQVVAEDVRARDLEPPVAIHLSGVSPELRRAFGTLLAAKLAAGGLAPVILDAPTPEAAEGAARAQGDRSLLRLTVEVEEGALRARGDLLGTWVNFWSGRAATRPAHPAAALAHAVEADAGALKLAAISPPTQPPVAPAGTAPRTLRLLGAVFARLESPPAAIAAGDLDGDGKDEVAALTDRAVFVYGSDGRLLVSHPLEGNPSTTPTREPFGALAVLPGQPRLAVWSSRFARGEVFTLDRARGQLRPVQALDAAPLGPTERGAFTPGQTTFTPEVKLAEARALTVPAPFTSASFAPPRLLFVHPDGSASLYPRPSAAPARLSGLGAGSALGDLDGDGTPELLTTSPLLQPTPDSLRVYALGPDGTPQEHEPLWQGALASGRALYVTTADLDGDKRREVVVGLWRADGTGELYLLRQGAP
ncbi:VCBS repeat-containing protein [Myxococcaceae bacterium GXIMD 01537]